MFNTNIDFLFFFFACVFNYANRYYCVFTDKIEKNKYMITKSINSPFHTKTKKVNN